MPSDYAKIRDDNIRRRGEEFDDIGRLISEQLYSDRTHFIYELLQNAEDALERRYQDEPNNTLPGSVKFLLFKDRLEFRHWGQPFNEKDVQAISDVLKGTKSEDIAQIGKFGIGFKSVYAFTATPEIHSGDEHFIIERYIRPQSAKRLSEDISDETIFIFPFNHENISPEKAHNLIAAKLSNLGSRVLLFLKRIDGIKWSIEKTREKGHYVKNSQVRSDAKQVTVIGQKNGQDEEEKWLVFERSLPVIDGVSTVRAEIAFRLENKSQDQTEGIVRINDSPLFVYFPTEKPTRFGFLIQGPYRTTPARDNIPKDDDWNKMLVKETAALIAEALQHLKETGLLTVALLEALPIRMDDFPKDDMFYPVVEAVSDALRDQEMLPADDGTFVSAVNAKLASAEWLRMLLNKEHLGELFRTNQPLKWLSGEITENGKPDLWKYIRENLKVEEITPDSFARKIDVSFLANQSDDWMISFYKFLTPQKALWKKKGGGYWDQPGPLRSKRFIRLQDGSHVSPFRDDESPRVYLTIGEDADTSLLIVKAEISQHIEVYQFLKELGIPDLDIVAEVIERILPKYGTGYSKVLIDEHKRDIGKIERAYSTDSQEKKQRLKEMLWATAFVLSDNPSSASINYLKPTEAYFRNDILLAYFAGNENIGFVSPEYEPSMLVILKDLGVADIFRISSKSSPHSTDDILFGYRNGKYVRGLKGFDPDIEVDGLKHALMNPPIEKSYIVWRVIAMQYSQCIKGKVLHSSRQDFSRNASTYEEKELISEFGQLLRDSTWLPGRDGKLYKPNEMTLDELHDSFVRDDKLAEQLCMKKDVVAKLALEAGVTPEDIELLKQYPEEFKEWKTAISAKINKPAFPTRVSSNPEHREERFAEQIDHASQKEYVQRNRSVRTTKGNIDQNLWLKEHYTNKEEKMVCQICKEEMPFRKRDGEYYFEAVEALSRDHFPKEHESQFLALCPLCAAIYKEYVKSDEGAMESFRNSLMNSEGPEVFLQLGELKTSIRFVETHYFDIKTILRAQEDLGLC